MLIGIAASLGAGAHEVLLHLVNEKGFLQLNLLGKPNSNHNINDHNALVAEEEEEESGNNNAAAAVVVRSPNEVLDFMTQQQRWLTSNYCIWPPLNTMHQVESLRRRPWFLLVSCDGPLLTRYHRFIKSSIFQAVPAVPAVPLDKFVEMDQKHRFGLVDHSAGSTSGGGLDEVMRSSDVHIVLNNDNPGQNHVKEALDSLDLTNNERLRPSWDTYFIRLAEWASHRSNCMKRRVGAVLVKNSQIIATGYNGTPRGVKNCNQGGCERCNEGEAKMGEMLDKCLCLHAEENALLEAGRERIQGGNSIIYCTTCPCLSCAKKIVQSGVQEVIYLQDYKTDKATFRLFGEAGIKIRKYSPMPTSLYMQQNGATTTTGKNDEGVECPANICELMNDLNVVYS